MPRSRFTAPSRAGATAVAGALTVAFLVAATVPSPAASPVAPSRTAAAGTVLFTDDFAWATPGANWHEGWTYSGWRVVFNGYGTVSRVDDGATGPVAALAPAVAVSAGVTHAALVTSTASYADLQLGVSVRNVRQLRTGSAPNPWEVGWVLWHYKDASHFYSVLLKPNGWEVGKQDPAYPGSQRFLATGSQRRFPIGAWNRVRIRQVGATISVFVNGKLLTTVVDRERPYLSGAIGLYAEDAQSFYTRVVVRSTS